MKLNQLCDTTLSEGWRDALGGVALGAATALGSVPDVSAAPPRTPPAAVAQSELSLQEIDALILQFNKNRTEENATIVFDQILKAIETQREAEEYVEAVKLAGKAMQVARSIRSDRYKEFANLNTELLKERKDSDLKKNLHSTLEKSPGNAAIRGRLIKLYLIKYDNVEKAVELTSEEVDKELQGVLQVVQRPIEDLSAGELFEVGKWYYVNGKIEIKALQNAKEYLEQFLDIHPKQDSYHLQAKQMSLEISKLIKKLMPATTAKIDTKLEWQPVMEVKKGQKLLITATGKWYDGKIMRGPAGNKIGNRNIGHLQGKIQGETDHKTFPIGKRIIIVVPMDGVLNMKVYQPQSENNRYGDNVGTLSVKVERI
jgi:hypothetical protein